MVADLIDDDLAVRPSLPPLLQHRLRSRHSQISHIPAQTHTETDELRRNNHELTEHLELALANLQRLSLENHQLRQHLEATSNIVHIGR